MSEGLGAGAQWAGPRAGRGWPPAPRSPHEAKPQRARAGALPGAVPEGPQGAGRSGRRGAAFPPATAGPGPQEESRGCWSCCRAVQGERRRGRGRGGGAAYPPGASSAPACSPPPRGGFFAAPCPGSRRGCPNSGQALAGLSVARAPRAGQVVGLGAARQPGRAAAAWRWRGAEDPPVRGGRAWQRCPSSARVTEASGRWGRRSCHGRCCRCSWRCRPGPGPRRAPLG